MSAVSIVKQGKRPPEHYLPDKLYESIYRSCLAVRSSEGSAESAARAVLTSVTAWLDTKAEVTSHDIRRKAARALTTYNPDAAYFYTHHKHVL